jgi:hypothetical protein
MSEQVTKGVVMAEVSAVVTRADGTIEDLGLISYYHRNPLKRWWVNKRHARKGEK